MVAEHRVLAVVGHGHLVQEVVGTGVRHHDLYEHLRVHRLLALLGILFIGEQGLGTVNNLRAFNIEHLLSVAFLEAQVIARQGHAVVQEREVVHVHVLVVVAFHRLEGIDQGRVRVSKVTEVSTDVAGDDSHVVLRLEALTQVHVVIKNRTDGAETEEEFAMIAREVERIGIHHNFKLVVGAAEVAGQVVVFGDNFELGLHVVLPNQELTTHILKRAFQFGVGDVAACTGTEHRNLERFHVGAACRGIGIFIAIFVVTNLIDSPRISLFAERHEERVRRIARTEHGNLQLLKVGIQVSDDLFERSVFIEEDEEFHKALGILESVEAAVLIKV